MISVIRREKAENAKLSVIYSLVAFIVMPISMVSNYYGVLSFYVNSLSVVVGVYCFIRLMLYKRKDSVIIFWYLFLLVNLGYYLWFPAPDRDSFGQMSGILLVNLKLYIFAYFAKKGRIDDNFMLLLFGVIFLVSVFLHFQAIIDKRGDRGVDDVVVNTSYFFSFLVPYIFFIKSRPKSFLLASIFVFLLVLGAKRGAIIVGFVGLLIWYVYSYQFFRGSKKRIFNRLSFGLFGFLVFSVCVYYFFRIYGFLYERMLDLFDGDGGSGRDVIFHNIVNSWLNSESVTGYIFGYGFSASRSFSGLGLYAHNDWLESLINFGFFGVSVYFMVWVSLICFIFRSKALSRKERVQAFSAFLCCFVASLFSMVYSSSAASISIILLGYFLGKSSRRLSYN